MSKLLNFTQTKGKWHKFPCFDLERRAKLYKNFTQKLLAVSLCMAVVLLGTPVTTFADPHVHITEYSGTKGDADYCLVCDVATKVNNLYRDSVDEITVENAAKVISQIHAIDQIKFALEDEQYKELIALTDGWSGGEYGELPSKYFKAKEKINKLGRTGGWLVASKNVLGVGGDGALDLSEAKVSLEVTPVEAADGTYVAKSDAETMNLDMYGMYDNFSMVLNETTTDFRGRRSFYKRYDVNAGVIDNVNNNGWTTSFLLPAGTYRIREVNREAPMIVDGEEFHTGSTTYTYNGTSTTSVVGEDDPGVVVQVAAGAVTPVELKNMAQGSLTVSCEVESPLKSDKEREFTFTVKLADTTITGTFSDMTFEYGVATFTLKDGESATATELPAGLRYTVAATAADGFTVDSEGSEGTIDSEGASAASFKFKRVDCLAVSCEVASPLPADKNKTFDFKVELNDTTITDTFGDMTFTNGVATFTLKDGKSAIITGLPDGTGFTVTSAAVDGFTVDPESYAGTIDSEGASKAAFKFARETGDLTVSCAVNSPVDADKDKEFQFTVTLFSQYVGSGNNANVLAALTDTFGDMTFKDGVATFTLKDGESKTATALPTGLYYAVTAVAFDGFYVTNSVGEVQAGQIVSGTSATSFTFMRETGDLEVAVDFESPLSQLPTFSEGKVTVTAVGFPELSGTFGDLTFDQGSAAFDYPGDNDFDLSATGLPAGTYTVIADGFAADGLSVNTTYKVDGSASTPPASVVLASGATAKIVVTNKISAASPVEKCFSKLPAALSGLTFNDTSQQLISAGTLHSSLAGCHVEYAVVETCPAEDSDSWSDSLPMETDAGTYKVWYRVVDSISKEVLGVSAEPILVTIAQRSLADADVELKYDSHAYTGEALEPDVTVTLDGDTLNGSTDYDVSYSNNTNAGTATVTITGTGNFTGTVNKTFTITKATPDSSDLTTSLDAFYGQTLSELHGRLAKPKDLKGNTLEGSWSWADKDGKPLSDDTKVGSVGEHTYTAVFIPTNGNYSTVEITVTVKVSVDTSKWGDAHERPGDKKTQYVDQAGKTSIEVKVDNLSAGSVLWLFEESYGTSAWYGLDLSADAFALDKGLRFYVRWVSPDDAEYNTYYSQLDDAQKARVEGDNGWIFLIGIEDPEGNKVQPAQPVNVYVQLGKDWDPEHLNAYYISAGADVGVPIKNLILYFPGGSGIFGCMTLSHFSPYFIFDELTDEEKASLELKPEDGNNQPTDKPNSSGTDLPGTGDIATQMTVAALGMVLVLALGIMLRLITNKKKFEE